jgi:hypothetical protein
MTPEIEKERTRLSHHKFLDWIGQDFAPTDMIPVWWKVTTPESDIHVHCALIPNERAEQALANPTWDLKIDGGRPGCVQHGQRGGTSVAEYHRFGGHYEAEPFLLHRSFAGVRRKYVEISEEFRLYHNLYYDRTTDKYLKIDGAGNDTEVIIVEPQRVLVRLLEIRQYLAARTMHLAIYFDDREHSRFSLEELGLEEGAQDTRNGLMKWGIGYGDFGSIDEWHTSSRLLGKRLFPPLPRKQCGIWPYNDESRKAVAFIVGVDEAGNEMLDAAAEYGGKSKCLRPIWFRKTVLDKYFAQPSKYSVEDGYLSCASLWGMWLDNHHADYVVAWLGDLNRDLPYEEQLHWRSHNVPRCGPLSRVFFGRQIECQPIDSDQPEHLFQTRFDDLIRACNDQLGWRLLMPLAAEDQHYLMAVRVPATDEQKEFDDLVLGLAKLLVDSLNEQKLAEFIPTDVAKGLRGSIAKLEAAFAASGVTAYANHIKFMRDLQNLRSTGSAHRKGSNYEKVAAQFGIGTQNLRTVFRAILTRSIELLDYLITVVRSGKLSPENAGAPTGAEPDATA